ncbi:MAG: HNH endonuclease [Acidobacteriaceae bacterium]
MAKRKMKEDVLFLLRPSIINPAFWFPDRPPKTEWDRIRSKILERDNYTCKGCGHRAFKYMNIHHLEKSSDNALKNLVTICVACHAVLHIGRNLDLQIIEIWQSPFSQAEIIRRTREGVRAGLSLAKINKGFKLKRGPYLPTSIQYANDLVQKIEESPRAYLPEPFVAVFVNLKRWQLE